MHALTALTASMDLYTGHPGRRFVCRGRAERLVRWNDRTQLPRPPSTSHAHGYTRHRAACASGRVARGATATHACLSRQNRRGPRPVAKASRASRRQRHCSPVFATCGSQPAASCPWRPPPPPWSRTGWAARSTGDLRTRQTRLSRVRVWTGGTEHARAAAAVMRVGVWVLLLQATHAKRACWDGFWWVSLACGGRWGSGLGWLGARGVASAASTWASARPMAGSAATAACYTRDRSEST